MEKKIFKLLYSLIAKDADIAALENPTMKEQIDALKAKIGEDFKMVTEITASSED